MLLTPAYWRMTRAGFLVNTTDVLSTCGRTEPCEHALAAAAGRFMLVHQIQLPARTRLCSEKIAYVVGISAVFHDKRAEELLKLSMLGDPNREIDSLMSFKDSLLVSRFNHYKGRAKRHGSCEMARPIRRELELKIVGIP